MKSIFICLYILLVTACNTSPIKNNSESWEKGKISDVEITRGQQLSNHSLKIPLTLIRNRASSWKNSELLELVTQAQRIFEQCRKFKIGISLSPVTLVELNHTLLNDLHYRDDYLFTKDLPKGIRKPIAIFTEKSRYSWGGYSNRAEVLNDEKKKVSYGSVFILRGSTKHRTGPYNYFYKGILAHELSHILLEEDPNELKGNILNHNLERGGNSLTKGQCEKIKKHAFVVK